MESLQGVQRFLSLWEKQPNGCIAFVGDHGSDGRGIFRERDSVFHATHERWRIVKGEQVPDGSYLIPTCDRMDCGEITHLELVTASEHLRRLNMTRWGQPQDRWESCCRRDEQSGCLIWIPDDPLFRINGRSLSARHFAFERRYQVALSVEDILRPTCGQERCIEPSHMEQISRGENARRNNAERWGEEQARWESAVDRDPETGCAIWRNASFVFRRKNGRPEHARRYGYEQHHGVTLSNRDIIRPRAQCEGTKCVDPTHMERMSRTEHGHLNRLKQMEGHRATV